MSIYIGYTSALEAYRAQGRLLPELLESRRTSKLGDGEIPAAIMLEDDLSRIGVKNKPYHLLFSHESQTHARPDIVRHVLSGTLPKRAFVHATEDVLIASPELMFVQLASLEDFSEVDLVQIGYELCGTYLLDPFETIWKEPISDSTPMTSTSKISRMIDGLGARRGVKRARKVLELVNDNSNSPMETVLALLFCLPRRLGGLALEPVIMNKKITTATGDRWVDFFFPEHNVGLEYKGKDFHSIEKVGRDDRRQNKLVGSGLNILNVWYEDLVDPHLFEQLVQDVVNAMGIRLRIRSEGFATNQRLLRMHLLPTVKRYGGFVA